ncbi:MAG: HdeD family acid-resistance protein [Nitrososphaera sp.]
MSETSMKAPGWMRWLQVGLGVLAIILAIYAIVYPGITLVTLVYILGIIFLIIGIERIIVGIFIPSGSRWGTIGLGILVIILASIAIAFPVGTTVALFIFLGFALLFDGIARIIHGFADKTLRGWVRGFYIGVGVLAVIFGGMVIVSPFFGAVLAGLIMGILLLIIGIEMIAAGIGGRQMRLRPPGVGR